jgi:hypothetical protein
MATHSSGPIGHGHHFVLTRADHVGRTDFPANVASVFEVDGDEYCPEYPLTPRPQVRPIVPPTSIWETEYIEPLPRRTVPSVSIIQTAPSSPRRSMTHWNCSDHGYAGVHCTGGRIYDSAGRLLAARRTPIGGRAGTVAHALFDAPTQPYMIVDSCRIQNSKRALLDGPPRIVNPLSGRKEDLRKVHGLLARARQFDRKQFG